VSFRSDDEHIIPLCLETLKENCAVLIFCPTKNWCEKLADSIARELYRIYGASTIKTKGDYKSLIIISIVIFI